MNESVYRLGTRKSLLAIAQSSWVARELERLNPGIKIELVGIETRGDVVLDKPLSQIEGKEFFTAELDHALLRGDVDLTVHSMKDLSLERPEAFQLAATPPREFAHDVMIFHESVTERLRAGLPIRIGTSSPRRLTLIPEFLMDALPRFEKTRAPILKFVEIRGNVNTRLSRVHEPEHSEKKLDAVVLAFAGLERLAIDHQASIELHRLLGQTLKMVLPLRQCPSAPAQGALAIEARASAGATLALIEKLHDPQTLAAVQAERKILEEWGGGCHQKLGASCLSDHTLSIKGLRPSGEWVEELRGKRTSEMNSFFKVEASDFFEVEGIELSEDAQKQIERANNVFIAHTRAFQHLTQKQFLMTPAKKHIWVSGMKSWHALASEGVWIEGSLEGHGFKKMVAFQQKKLLGLNSPFCFITHEDSAKNMDHSVATYRHRFRTVPDSVRNAKALHWSSGLLFKTAWRHLGADLMLAKKHASGPGRSAEILQEYLTPHGVTPDVFNFES